MTKVFISYRRSKKCWLAPLLAERIRQRFGRASCFLDIECIAPGEKIRAALLRALSACEILLVVVDKKWVNTMHNLAEPEDFVRTEIEFALKRGVAVIIAIDNRLDMPNLSKFPVTLQTAFETIAFPIDRKNHFSRDCEELLKEIERVSSLRASGTASALPRRRGFFDDVAPATRVGTSPNAIPKSPASLAPPMARLRPAEPLPSPQAFEGLEIPFQPFAPTLAKPIHRLRAEMSSRTEDRPETRGKKKPLHTAGRINRMLYFLCTTLGAVITYKLFVLAYSQYSIPGMVVTGVFLSAIWICVWLAAPRNR